MTASRRENRRTLQALRVRYTHELEAREAAARSATEARAAAEQDVELARRASARALVALDDAQSLFRVSPTAGTHRSAGFLSGAEAFVRQARATVSDARTHERLVVSALGDVREAERAALEHHAVAKAQLDALDRRLEALAREELRATDERQDDEAVDRAAHAAQARTRER